MFVASSYPFLDVFWTMLIFFLWVAWFIILFRVIGDVLRRHDIGGGGKVLWLTFVILLPFLGVFIYLIAQNRGMAERSMDDVKAAQQQFDERVRAAASTGGGAAGEIAEAKQLLDTDVITQAEFAALKVKALA